MRIALPIGISAGAVLLTSQLVGTKNNQSDLKRSFAFEETEVVADAGAAPRSAGSLDVESNIGRSFVFAPVVVAGRAHKHVALAQH